MLLQRATSSQISVSLPSPSSSHKSFDVSEAVNRFRRNALVHLSKNPLVTWEENRNNKAGSPVCSPHRLFLDKFRSDFN